MGSRLSEFWASRIAAGPLISTSTRNSCPTASLTSIQNRFDNLGFALTVVAGNSGTATYDRAGQELVHTPPAEVMVSTRHNMAFPVRSVFFQRRREALEVLLFFRADFFATAL